MKAINLKTYIPHIASILIFVIISFVYFSPVLQSKKLVMGDYINYQGMAQEIKEHNDKNSDKALWTNSMFGGMPAYQIHVSNDKNLLSYVNKILNLFAPRPVGTFIMGCISFFILLLVLKVNPWIAMIASLGFAYTTNNVVLLHAGHVTKVNVIMVSPLVVAGVILAYRRQLALGFVCFSIGMGVNLLHNHVQMTYYLGILLFFYVLTEFGFAIKEKTISDFTKSSLILLLGLVLAVGSTAQKLWPTYEYGRDTMRGKPILETERSEVKSSSNVEGLDWDYAMNWSNGFKDLIPSFIPLAVGGSNAESVGTKSEVLKALKKRGYRGSSDIKLPTYWGDLPSTSGPIYFGAIMFFLFLFGAFYIKGPVKWWSIFAVILTLLLSMGRNLEVVSRFFFDFVPMYNKFRTPNSILSVTCLFFPLLGAIALDKAIKAESKKDIIKPLFISGGIIALCCLLLALLGGSFFDFSGASDARAAQSGIDVDALKDDRFAMMRSSAFRTLMLVLISMGALWTYFKGKVSAAILLLVLAALTLFDQITIDKRYLNNDSFVSSRQYKNNFAERPVDTQILQDTDPHYRVMDASLYNTFSSSASSYHHKTIGGNHAAKLQRFEDIKIRHLLKNNMAVFNMLNTKYFIQGEAGKEQAQQNPGALGNAWFVGNIKTANTANEEIDMLNGLNPATTAIVHKSFGTVNTTADTTGRGQIKLQKYSPNEISYVSTNPNQQLAVFSEVWYGPDKGWNAYIDGTKQSYIRANYILRALEVPAGNHNITFKFEPKSYKLGGYISLLSSLLIILLSGFYLFRTLKGS